MQPVIQLRSSRTTASSLLQLGKGRTQIRPIAGCGLRLQHQGVSRDHGAFTYCIGLLMVEDHDSTNGIFVNGVRVKRQVLRRAHRDLYPEGLGSAILGPRMTAPTTR